MFSLSFRIPDVIERFKERRFKRDSEGRSLASNLVFTIWAVFGGFILHFLLSNYLTVLLRPSYEEPVETVADLVERDIIPFYGPGGEIFIQFFAASSDPNYQELSRRLIIPKNWDDYEELVYKVTGTGMYADIGPFPDEWYVSDEEHKEWYRSSQTVGGTNPYGVHLKNKKWPLKGVI